MSKRSHEDAFEADQMLGHIRRLHQEAGDSQSFFTALSTLSTIISNVLEHPEEPRYRTIRLLNSSFRRRLGRFAAGVAILRAVGFEDAFDGEETSGTLTHLALPVANVPILAQAVVLIAAAIEAAASLDGLAAIPATKRTTIPESLPLGRAEGKLRITNDTRDVEPLVGSEGTSTAGSSATHQHMIEHSTARIVDEAVVELSEYSADSIDSYFRAIVSASGDGLGDLSLKVYDRLAATAKDAVAVASSMRDVKAAACAERWLETLREHGAIIGWSDDIDARENNEQPMNGQPSTNNDSDGVENVVAEDGNLDTCGTCGARGLLVCCDGCPLAYHTGCLPATMRPHDDDEDSEWLCPSCRK
eukprot:scaffold60777_cov39-Tisochrysis_lutea.AAC.1